MIFTLNRQLKAEKKVGWPHGEQVRTPSVQTSEVLDFSEDSTSNMDLQKTISEWSNQLGCVFSVLRDVDRRVPDGFEDALGYQCPQL